MTDSVEPHNQAQVEILLKQYEIVSAEIKSVMSSLDRTFSFALLVLGAGLAYGVVGKEPLALIVVPIPLLIIALYWQYLVNQIGVLGGHKAALEGMINERVGHRLLFWEETATRLVNGAVAELCLSVAYVGFLLTTAIVATYASWTTFKSLWLTPTLAMVFLLFFVGLVASWRQGLSAKEHAARLAAGPPPLASVSVTPAEVSRPGADPPPHGIVAPGIGRHALEHRC